MPENCHAHQTVPVAYGTGTAGLACGLPMAHQGALHHDPGLRVYWMAQPAYMAEDIPAAVRMNEDIPAALQGQWHRAEARP
jgi:hypothetical protein